MEQDRSDLRRVLAYVAPYWRRLVLVLVLSLTGTVLSLFIPYLSKLLVDSALLGRDMSALTRIIGLFVGITAASFAINVISGMRYTRVSADILFDMRRELYRHLQRLSPRLYSTLTSLETCTLNQCMKRGSVASLSVTTRASNRKSAGISNCR